MTSFFEYFEGCDSYSDEANERGRTNLYLTDVLFEDKPICQQGVYDVYEADQAHEAARTLLESQGLGKY